MRIASYCCLLLLFISCSKSKFPGDVLPPEKMQAVFWDIIKADVWTTDYIQRDSSKIPMHENIAIQKKIFQFHGVTKNEFYNSFDYYTRHPELMSAMLDSMVARQGREKNKPQIKTIKEL